MRFGYIAFIVASAALVGGLMALLLAVGQSPELDIPEEELAQARQRHQRSTTARSVPPEPTPTRRSPTGPAADSPPRVAGRAEKPSAPRPRTFDRNRSARDRSVPRPRPISPPPEPPSTGPRPLKERLDQANKYYDRGEFENAVEQALEVLEDHPRNVRMLRVVVSASCIMGDEDMARKHFPILEGRDRRDMQVRCKRYGVEL